MELSKYFWVCKEAGCGFKVAAHTVPILAMLVDTHKTGHKISRYNFEHKAFSTEPKVVQTIVKRETEPLTAFDLTFLKAVGAEAW